MKRSQTAGIKYYNEPAYGQVTLLQTISNGNCSNCNALVEYVIGEKHIYEPELSVEEFKNRLNSYGLISSTLMNQIIGGVDTPSEQCCGKCQHTVTRSIW